MRRETELVKSTKPFAREIRWLSWWHLWSTLAALAGLMTVTCLPVSWLLRVPCSVLAGLVLVRLFIIFHDYQHGTILRGSLLADFLMMVYGLFTLNPPRVWNRTHNYHHRNNAQVPGESIGSFPVMTTEMYARASWLNRFHYHLARHPLTILFGFFTVFLYSLCIRAFVANPRQNYDSALSMLAIAGLIVVLVLFAPLSVLFLAYLLPCMVGGALGAYLFYAQHNFPDVQFQDEAQWDYVFAALKSSSYMTMNPVMHWFTGNIGYHHVHHLNHHIPFYRLPEAMAKLEHLQAPVQTSLWPADVYRCLRLKLWDPEKKRMVGYSGT
jgi:omega-6 fatty acid desaturase (delta-12 desaturase)